ncbi:MAG: branched-chain amino acid ABC transporter permease [Sporichthyaceae bacterium]
MNWELLDETIVLGVLVAGLYGFLPVAVVLTYRISRTIAFVHGGFAIFGGLLYGVLVNGTEGHAVPHPIVDRGWIALVLVAVATAVLAAGFGALVMSRFMAELPGITLTVVSVAGLLLVGNMSGYWLQPGGFSLSESPFPSGGQPIGDVVVTYHRLFTLLLLIALVVGLTFFLNRTYTGLAIRAIADDVEASVWCGAKLRVIGTGVYGASGAIAGIAGALYASAVADAVDGFLNLFVIGLLLAVVGGMRSVGLALIGALFYGILSTLLVGGFAGTIGVGKQQVILFGGLLALIVVAARLRRENFFQLAGHHT